MLTHTLAFPFKLYSCQNLKYRLFLYFAFTMGFYFDQDDFATSAKFNVRACAGIICIKTSTVTINFQTPPCFTYF